MEKFKWEVSRDAAWTDNYLTVQAEAQAQSVDAEKRYRVVLKRVATFAWESVVFVAMVVVALVVVEVLAILLGV